MEAARSFGATRLDWCYTHDAAFVEAAKSLGLSPIGGALNTTLPDFVDGKTATLGRIVDRWGNPLTAPWMKSWSSAWGCVNSPEYRRTYLAHASAALQSGVEWFTVDSPEMNVHSVQWGGCFCRYCISAAKSRNLDLDSQMLEFQKTSVTNFHLGMRAAIDAVAGRHIEFASNNFGRNLKQHFDWPYTLFDFGMSEITADESSDPKAVQDLLVEAEIRGRPQTLTLVSEDVEINQKMIAWCCANGGNMIVPWDVYLALPNQPRRRFFGEAADYAPLSSFARRLGRLLDDAAFVPISDLAPWSISSSDVQTSFRVLKDRKSAVLHLVPWAQRIPSRISIDMTRPVLPGTAVRAARARSPDQEIEMTVTGNFLTCEMPAAIWIAIELQLDNS